MFFFFYLRERVKNIPDFLLHAYEYEYICENVRYDIVRTLRNPRFVTIVNFRRSIQMHPARFFRTSVIARKKHVLRDVLPTRVDEKPIIVP